MRPSFMDLFFHENPQRLINDVEDIPKVERKPGKLVDPLIMIDDPNRVTVAASEELDSIDE